MLGTSQDFFSNDTGLKPFEIKESSKIDSEMKRMIEDTANFTCLSQGDSCLLLRYFKWNVNKMNDLYYDDPDKYLELSHIEVNGKEPEKGPTTCDVCYEEVDELISLSCGHGFCKNCWKDHVVECLNGPNAIDSLCMASGCKCKIHFELVKKKEYVENQGNVFCPNPLCGRAIVILTSERPTDNIFCLCGQRFCFHCLSEYHSPATCTQVSDWNSLSTKDDENSYLLLTAKACYHCGLLCERTTGCNHMTCPKCKGQWCWMCRGDWATHGGTKGNELDDKAKNQKQFYEKYNHYFDRWMNHNSLHRMTREKKTELISQVHLHFKNQSRVISRIEDAFGVLILARCWLKFSYVHSFYLSETNGISDLFNHQQAQIETFTESLSDLLFKPVETFDPETISAKASILKKVVEHFS
ncbi:RBR-type E3 ubiquitin transferase [Entamoeba marina]